MLTLQQKLEEIFVRTVERIDSRKLTPKDRKDLEDVTREMAKMMEEVGLDITPTTALVRVTND